MNKRINRLILMLLAEGAGLAGLSAATGCYHRPPPRRRRPDYVEVRPLPPPPPPRERVYIGP